MELQQQAAKAAAGEDGSEETRRTRTRPPWSAATAYARRTDRCPRPAPAPTNILGGGPPTGHLADVLSISISADGRMMASGGKDNLILLWIAERTRWSITSRPWRPCARRPAARDGEGGTEFYSRRVTTARVGHRPARHLDPLWSPGGHHALDALTPDTVLSGSEDRTVRLWKVAEETQLLFSNGHAASVDAVAMLHGDAFLSGAQDGSIALWSSKRKKYLAKLDRAHGVADSGSANWISALCAPAFSDVAISGSCDGVVRFWHANEDNRSLDPLLTAPVTGVVNGFAMAPSGKFLACAVGQEHRLGRWFKVPKARNALCLVPLPQVMHVKQRLSVAAATAKALRGGTDRPDDDDDDEALDDDDDAEDDDDDE